MEPSTLLERCRQGDPLAWEEFVHRYQSRIYGLAFHYVRDAAEAEDLAQEIFIRLYEKLHVYEGGSFAAWMLRVARNLCLDRLRRRKARPPLQDLDVGDGFDLPDPGDDPHTAWIGEARSRLVWRAMARMSASNREMILLKEIQGLELQEIASLLNTPLGTVKSRSNRARLELARRVADLDPAFEGPAR